MISLNNPVIDYSELIGKKVSCPPECGLCCLCQPEVLPEEYGYFKAEHSRSIVRVKDPDDHFALAMKKGRGSCVFLNERRCAIYEKRPTYCRQFPFHFHVSDRIRVELDLSCRGAWYDNGKGADAVSEAERLAYQSADRLKTALKEASSVYAEFFGICKETGVYAERADLRSSVHKNLDNFTDLGYIAKVMDASLEEPSMSLSGITAGGEMGMEELNELNRAAMEASMDSMRSPDPLNVPVYCDGKWNWNLFMVKKDAIEWSILDDEGDLHFKGSADPADIVLKRPDAGATAVLKDYISVLNERDSFMGSVFHIMDSLNYEDDMTNVYYGSMSVSVIDLLWRSAMLDRFIGTGNVKNWMREAIIFYDMDRLDAPTIGAFV